MIRRLFSCASLLIVLSTIGSSAIALSTEEERSLGRKFDLQARARLPLITDPEVDAYLERIGTRIVDSLGDQPFTYRFAALNDSRINAFAVPGGFVYVHSGMIVRASSEDEVAAVLSHEIAHVDAHHLARQQDSTRLLNYTALLGALLTAVQPAAGLGAVALSMSQQLAYRREFEQEADFRGARQMAKAGYDPRGMLAFFKKLLDEQRTSPSFAPPYLRTHPLTEQRLTSLEANLDAHSSATAASAATDRRLDWVQLLLRARSSPPDEVTRYYRQQAESSPQDGYRLFLLGAAEREIGAFQEAKRSLLAAHEMGYTETRRELARVSLALGDFRSAEGMLRQAAIDAPDDVVVQLSLAKAEEALGNMTAAMEAYQAALRLDPRIAEAHQNLGILLGRDGKEGEGYYHLGLALQLRGDGEKALAQLQRAAAQLPAGSREEQATREAIGDLERTLAK